MTLNSLQIESHSRSSNDSQSFETAGPIGPARLALGTVQFGLPYGVANTQGQVSYDQASAMIEAIRTAGINTIDTAIAYGEAESVLGRIGVSDFRLISKIPSISKFALSADDWVIDQVETSLKRLCVPRLGGLMLHAPDDLLGPNGLDLARGLRRARDEGLVERIGLSVYSPEQLAAVFDRLPVEIMQIPANVFDRRFAESGWLDRLTANGVEVHARSTFLQGLLLMPIEQVPSKFAPFLPLIKRWHVWLKDQGGGVLPLQACLGHVASYKSIARIVVGADSLKQLQEIIEATSKAARRTPSSLSSPTTPLINPTQWNTL